jgi:hypothetical protein
VKKCVRLQRNYFILHKSCKKFHFFTLKIPIFSLFLIHENYKEFPPYLRFTLKYFLKISYHVVIFLSFTSISLLELKAKISLVSNPLIRVCMREREIGRRIHKEAGGRVQKGEGEKKVFVQHKTFNVRHSQCGEWLPKS